MKKQFLLLIMALSLSVFVGCDYDDEFTPPNYVTFDKTAYSLNVDENSSSTMEVTVYTSNITGSDRTFAVNVDPSSTLSAAALDLPSTVTVPANSNEVTFTVGVSDTDLNNAGDKLVLTLGEEPGLTAGPAYTINISRICPFEVIGDYTNASGWFEAEYAVEVQAGSSANEYVVKDMFEDGTDITFTVNEDSSITVPKQAAWVSATYGQASVEGQAGSKVEPCLGLVTLVLKHTVSAGSFGVASEVLTKQ